MHFDNQFHLKDVLRDLVNDLHWEQKLNETKIRQVWAEKMGATINGYTKEISLRKDRLFISLTSAPLRQELNYEREKIRKMMNDAIGREAVREVMVI